MMRTWASIDGEDAKGQTELGLAEATIDDYAAAERAFRAAIRLEPTRADAWLELGLVLETLNRTDELTALAAEAALAGLGAEAHFLKAWAMRRAGRHEEALAERRSDAGDDQSDSPPSTARRPLRPARPGRRGVRFSSRR